MVLCIDFSPVGFSNFFEPVAPPEGATLAYFTGAARGGVAEKMGP